MINYQSQGLLPKKPHTAFRKPSGELYYEQCVTQQGFEGPFSILYHQQPPQQIHNGSMATPLWPQPHAFQNDTPEPLRRRHFRSQDFKPFGSPCTGRMPMLFNEHITVGAVKPTANDDFYFCNGDGDDLFYIHEGAGTLISWYGHLEFKAGDYLVVPRGTLHRFKLTEGLAQHWFWVESSTSIQPPEKYRNASGQLRMDAPYTHRDFKVPTLNTPVDLGGPKRQVTKKRRAFTAHDHAHNPMDTVGWDGTIYPFVFAMDDFSPKTGEVHLPPTTHATFATEHALICSFVPRLVDFGEDAVTCPYPHGNVDVEEVLFYADGDFTSRKGTSSGSMSFHPSGVPHGPHPGAYEKSIGVKKVQERAVMLDVTEPLFVSPQAREIEDRNYDESWLNLKGDES